MNTLKYLEATVNFNATEDPNALPKFSIKANAGSRMSFDRDVVIDLAGKVDLKDARGVPILYGHDWDCQLGHATSIRVDDDGIWLEGVVSVPSERAREWVNSAKAGFPWNASLGFMIEESSEIEGGDKIGVNGREEIGPCVVARAIRVWECSVVTFGADPNTNANITAKEHSACNSPTAKGKEMNDENIPVVDPAADNVQNNIVDAQNDVEALREERAKENERIDALESLARQYGDREYLNAAIREGWTAEKFELETLRHARSSVPTSNTFAANVDATKVTSAALMRACGVKLDEKLYSAQELEAADKLGSQDFRGVFEAATGFNPTTSQRADAREWVQAAVSTYDLPNVLSTTANAILLNALGKYERRWAPLFKVSSVQDYRKAERWRIDSDFEFDEVAEAQEFQHGTQSEEGWEIQAKMYGKQYVLPYQSMINGEALGVFSDIMQQIAYGAESKLNRICWGLIMNPGNANDGTAFYHANHGSLLTGKAFSLDNLSAAISAFVSRKKMNDTPIGIEPTYLVVPPTLVAAARNVVNSSWLNDSASGKVGADYNPMKGIVEIITAPQLEFNSFTNYSASTWYLFAAPTALAAFEIAFLRGVQSPALRSSELEIGRIGIGIDGHISFGVAAEDYRAAMKITA